MEKEPRTERCESCKKQFSDHEVTVTFSEDAAHKTLCTKCASLYQHNYRQKMIREKRRIK
ncbi:hypothetical protein [Cytobacillus praedii]|uniref:hypothetical protein n=1 Tax=Cytobacillus praedii TaxID=1742358 RepID=UPI002E223922|nr:hypothetical protein [Cytobacillus praedii]